MWYLIIKTINGKKHFMSTTGKWITTKSLAAMNPNKDSAMEYAKQVGGWIQAK